MAVEKKKAVNRGPVKPRVFFVLYRGNIEGEVTVTFDKMKALETVLEANGRGDTSLKMIKMEVPKGTRQKAPVAPAAA